MPILISWIISSLAILASAYLLPGITVDNFLAALTAAIVLGLANAILKPVLILLTLPINFLSMGLFTLVINAGLVMLTAYIVPGFFIAGFWWAVLMGLVLSLVSAIIPD
ncbi:MAG: phage holin family protein [Candidatus Colwellbacteria bacterium]|nr:phage holin family protein [Candidatus Colwellbacteria bacterium]